jgi:hypothetical protein
MVKPASSAVNYYQRIMKKSALPLVVLGSWSLKKNRYYQQRIGQLLASYRHA